MLKEKWPRNRVIVEVVDIRGKCPVYEKGDVMVLDEPNLVLKETKALCVRAMGPLMTFLIPVAAGIDPSVDGAKYDNPGQREEKGTHLTHCPTCALASPTEPGAVLFRIRMQGEPKTHPTKTYKKLRVEVIEVHTFYKGCPNYQVGDVFYMTGNPLRREDIQTKSGQLCNAALADHLPLFRSLIRGADPIDTGLTRRGEPSNVAYMECHDPSGKWDLPFRSATVVFRVTRIQE